MQVLLTPQSQQVEIERAKRFMVLLEQLSTTPGTALVIRGEHVLTDNGRLSATDEIELRSVVSGG
ncbi:MAG: thiamine biosynthesis protein ThiS [Candidatus Binatia bacterium]|nr:thiamine biosynthesis protein ThiS [Candidatus Binatia bacterium]